MSTFFGLNIARSGMYAQQKSLEVTAHNIANANTPGYSRQLAHMVPTRPIPYPHGDGMLGSGVVVEEIARVRDGFLDMQIREELQTMGQWDSRRHVLNQVEQIFMEPSETGFNKVLGRFFDSWQELSLNPESSPVRSTLVQNSSNLINTVKHTYDQLKTIRSDIDDSIALKVKDVNSLAERIKDLNGQIVSLVALKETPSDLMDQRDLLIDQLAEIIDFNAIETDRGSINIYLGGRELVRESTASRLKTISGGIDESYEPHWHLAPKIVWEHDEKEVNLKNGEIAGLVETRDKHLRSYMEDFETLVWGVIDIVNETHGDGMDLNGDRGGLFFTPGKPDEGEIDDRYLDNLRVNQDIIDDLKLVAASAYPDDADPLDPDPNPGDGSNALNIAKLRYSRIDISLVKDDGDPQSLRDRITLDPDGGSNFENFYRDNIARLGVDSQESQHMVKNQGALLDLMTKRRDSISGVSLDEEMANMVQFQLSYQASARMITTLNEIYDTIINRM